MRDAEGVLQLIKDADDEGDGPVLSVFIADPALYGSREAAIRHVCEDASIPHGKIRVASYGAIAADGRRVEPDTSGGQAECHHHVVFSAVPTIFEIETFLDLFEEPIRNPVKE